jgi:hypothetical protein
MSELGVNDKRVLAECIKIKAHSALSLVIVFPMHVTLFRVPIEIELHLKAQARERGRC